MKRIIILTMILFTISLSAKVNRMTIIDFDNNSGIRKYNSFGKGLADMLTTDLAYVKGLEIVEREKLREIMKELNLSKSKYISRKSALKLGRGLAANWILKGHFTTLNGKMRISANIINIETSKVIEGVYVEGWTTKFFDLERRLIKKIVRAIHTKEKRLTYIPENKKELKDFKSVLEYSKGVDLYDEGKFKESEKAFRRALKFDNNFDYSDKYLRALEERLKKYSDKRNEKENKKIKEILDSYEKNKNKKYSYTEIMQIHSALIMNKKQDLALKLLYKFRENLPVNTKYIKYDELVQYMIVTDLMTLKKYDDVLKEGENFLKTFPNSTYFSSVEWNVKRAINIKKEMIIKNDKYGTYQDFVKNYSSLKLDQKIYFGKVKKILEKLYKNLSYSDYLELVNFTRTHPPKVSNKSDFKSSMQSIEYMELIVLRMLRKYDEYILKGNSFVKKYPNTLQTDSFIKPGIERVIKDKEKYEKEMVKNKKKYKKEKRKRKKRLKKDLKYKAKSLKAKIRYREKDIARELNKGNDKNKIKSLKERLKKLEDELEDLPIVLEKRMIMDLLAKAVRYQQYKEVLPLSQELLKNKKNLSDYEILSIYNHVINNYHNQGNYTQATKFYKTKLNEFVLSKYEKKYIKNKKYLEKLKELKDGNFDDKIDDIDEKLDDDDLNRTLKSKLRKEQKILKDKKRELEKYTKKISNDFKRIKSVIERIKRNMPK